MKQITENHNVPKETFPLFSLNILIKMTVSFSLFLVNFFQFVVAVYWGLRFGLGMAAVQTDANKLITVWLQFFAVSPRYV